MLKLLTGLEEAAQALRELDGVGGVLASIARDARDNEIARPVSSTLGQWDYVVDMILVLGVFFAPMASPLLRVTDP
jgi:hypothetical protein